MSRQRLPLALSVAALLIAVFGSTPFGQAAVVKVIPFAKNADTVDRLHASTIAKPGVLFPLGADAKFPSSVVPAQPEKVLRAWARYHAAPVSVVGEFAELSLPDANVIVRAKAAFGQTYYGPASSISCSLIVGSEHDDVTFAVPSYSSSVVVPFEVAAHRGGARTAFLRCDGASYGSSYVRASSIRMSAIEVDDLTNTQE